MDFNASDSMLQRKDLVNKMGTASQFSKNDSGEFCRIEDKHLIKNSEIEKVLSVITSQMEPKYMDDKTTFTLVESIYFDSPGLDFYQDHFLNKDTRYKLRIRRYGPNGVWSNKSVQVELKEKKLGISKKRRFEILPEDLHNLEKGILLTFNSALVELNPKIEESVLKKRVQKINKLFLKYKLVPSLKISYMRLAFEKDNFRATIDSKINFCPILPISSELANSIRVKSFWPNCENLIKKFDPNQFRVLELKHMGEIPDWMKELLVSNAIKKTSFSKYAWFLSTLVNNTNERPNLSL